MLKSLADLPMVIKIAGIDIKVTEDNVINSKDINVVAAAISLYPEQEIRLRIGDRQLDIINQALYHELLHWIFYLMNEFDICQNEEIIDRAALLLHGAMKSFRS